MTTADFIQEINDKLRALDDEAPSSGSDEFLYWLRIANRVRRNLYKDTKKQWSATFQVVEVGTISASTAPTFDLEDTFLSPASGCYVITTEDVRHDFDIVEPQDSSHNTQQCYIAGDDPKILYFTQEIAASNQIVGGTLYLPAYVMPDAIASTGTVVCDDPDWLVVATAAQIAAGDLTYEDKVGDLNAEANSLYKQMTSTNRGGVAGKPRTSKYDVPSISGY
jgi:hypothetical protein